MRKQRSIGEMISSITFFGLALYLFPYSLSLLDEGHQARGYFGLLGAGLLRARRTSVCDRRSGRKMAV